MDYICERVIIAIQGTRVINVTMFTVQEKVQVMDISYQIGRYSYRFLAFGWLTINRVQIHFKDADRFLPGWIFGLPTNKRLQRIREVRPWIIWPGA